MRSLVFTRMQHIVKGSTDVKSSIAYINVNSNNPFDLFNPWYEEAKKYVLPPITFSVATVSKENKVSNRHLVLNGVKNERFLMMTDARSKKCSDLANNPSVAAVFLWNYTKDETRFVRQVRVEGKACQSSREICEEIFNKEPLYAKIRSNICQQGAPINWDDLKAAHDKLLNEVTSTGDNLAMPDHTVVYEIIPDSIEFYYSTTNHIADRILFKKNEERNEWSYQRICA